MTALEHKVTGVDHAAFPTFDPAATIRFYRDMLGFPVAHAIVAKGWGPADHPDFIHFFFDIGQGDRVAFFYYFGLAPLQDRGQGDAYAAFGPEAPLFFVRSRHLAIHVETEAELLEYKRRMDASAWPCEMLVTHETIESIYVHDPNGYFVEITRPTRPVLPVEITDANLTIDALIETVTGPAPSLAKLWENKGRRLPAGDAVVAETSVPPPTTLFVLDAPESAPLAEVAKKDPEVTVRKVGAFFEITKQGTITIDRRATGCRHAVWYSSVAGVRAGKVTQYDKDALRVEPA